MACSVAVNGWRPRQGRLVISSQALDSSTGWMMGSTVSVNLWLACIGLCAQPVVIINADHEPCESSRKLARQGSASGRLADRS